MTLRQAQDTSKKNGVAPRGAAPALPIFPAIEFNDGDYARIRMRFDLYSDMIVATRFDDSAEGRETYAVDPADVAGALANLTLGSGLLPRNCLFWQQVGGEERLGIYIEPRIWPVSVEREKLTWRVPMPGLVFIGQAKKYNLYAIKDTIWPEAKTPLYLAPVPNVWGDRGVCSGNAPFPVAGAATIWQAAQVFFESGFNNHLANGKSKAHQGNILDQWKALHKAGAQEYPLDDLVEARVSLAGAMEAK